MVLNKINSIVKGDFFKSFTVLLSGTLIAQIIGYTIAPILTRLYTTEEMGELGFYMRLTGFIAAIATLRYEAALPLPKKDEHSFLLYRLAFLISMVVLIILAVVFLFLIVSGIGNNFDWWFYLFTVLGTSFVIIINLGTSWSVRMGQYSIISRHKIVNSLVANLLKWLFAFFHLSAFGLILATLTGYFLSCLEFAFNFKKIRSKYKDSISNKKTKVLMLEHKEFPTLNLPHVFVDNGRDMLIATLIFAYYSIGIYGSFNHSYTMLRIPLMLVGVTLGQLFYNKASELYNQKKSIMPLLNKILLLLSALSIVPFSILFFYGEPIFIFIFGPNWGQAGGYSETMSVWLMFNFILSPISVLPLIIGKQKIAFLFGIISSLIQILPLWLLPMKYGHSEEVFDFTLKIISCSQSAWLAITLVVFYSLAKKMNVKNSLTT
jgi:O-antigen/teichoic acid export membrane protein